jgi:hypothetical protein
VQTGRAAPASFPPGQRAAPAGDTHRGPGTSRGQAPAPTRAHPRARCTRTRLAAETGRSAAPGSRGNLLSAVCRRVGRGPLTPLHFPLASSHASSSSAHARGARARPVPTPGEDASSAGNRACSGEKPCRAAPAHLPRLPALTRRAGPGRAEPSAPASPT